MWRKLTKSQDPVCFTQRVLNNLGRTRLSRRSMIWPLTPPPLPPVSELSLFLSLPVCRRSSLLTEERGEGGGGGAKSYASEEALSSINHLILSEFLLLLLLDNPTSCRSVRSASVECSELHSEPWIWKELVIYYTKVSSSTWRTQKWNLYVEEVMNFIADPKHGQVDLVGYAYNQVGFFVQFWKFTRAQHGQ